MTDKIKVWKCDVCGAIYRPCCGNRTPKWKVTDAPPKTPNCSICEWRTGHPPVQIKNFDELNKAASGLYLCSAQGDKHNGGVYNSPECQKLFSDNRVTTNENSNP